MQKYRLYITLFLSFSLHALLLAFLLIHQKNLGFKKGIGEHRIKASFRTLSEIPQMSSSTPIPPQPIPKSSNKPSATKKQSPQEPAKTKKEAKKQEAQKEQPKEALKDIPLKEPIPQENQEENTQETLEQSLQNLELTPQESQELENSQEQTPPLPIEKTLAYQFADTYTKKNISEIYGAEFGQLGTEEQEFILNNLSYIGRITQSYLRYPANAGMLKQEGMNVVEFYLHPNGDISDLKIIKPSGFILLDRNSTRTIEIAYKDYPHPKVKTLIRFYISYIMRPY